MRAHAVSVDIGVAVLSEYNEDGFIGIGLDAYGEEASGLQPAEAHHPYGFLGRPLDPDTDGEGQPTKGASLYRFDEANGTTVLVCGDPRITANLPQVAKGGSIQYAATEAQDVAYAHLDGADGSWVVHVPASAAKARIEFENGPTFEITSTTATLSGPPGGPTATVDATKVELGGPGAQPVVIDNGGLTAYFVAASAAFAALGQSVSPPAGYTATKVTAL